MLASRYIQEELKLIDSRYFAVYDEPHRKWRIRKWKSVYSINHRPENWVWDSDPIMNLDAHEDINMYVVHSMREGFYNARNIKRLLQEIDDSNDMQEVDHEESTEAIGRDMAKQIWRHYREGTIDLGAH